MRQPLPVKVDVNMVVLIIGDRWIAISGSLDARIVQKQGDGVAMELASAARVTALGPVGFALGRVAKSSGIGETRQFALKLTINDERDLIRVIEVTPDPLPLNSAQCA